MIFLPALELWKMLKCHAHIAVAEPEIVLDRQASNDATTLCDQPEPLTYSTVKRKHRFLTTNAHPPAQGFDRSSQRHESGRLARSVAASEKDDLARLDFEVYVADSCHA